MFVLGLHLLLLLLSSVYMLYLVKPWLRREERAPLLPLLLPRAASGECTALLPPRRELRPRFEVIALTELRLLFPSGPMLLLILARDAIPLLFIALLLIEYPGIILQ